jgi:hypothetical protein
MSDLTTAVVVAVVQLPESSLGGGEKERVLT